jgi:Leucine-rich repeat (LRR) protein
LKWLDASTNYLSGVSNQTLAVNLQYVSLKANVLRSAAPLFELTSLSYLDLNANLLREPLPLLAGFTLLKTLNLGSNYLYVSIACAVGAYHCDSR